MKNNFRTFSKLKRINAVMYKLGIVHEAIHTQGPLPHDTYAESFFEGCFLDQRREIDRAAVEIHEIINA